MVIHTSENTNSSLNGVLKQCLNLSVSRQTPNDNLISLMIHKVRTES